MSPGVMLMPVIIVVGLLRRHKKRRRNTMKYTGSIIWGWPQNTFATLGVWKQMKRLQAWYTHTHGMARIIYGTSKPPGWTARSSDRPERTSIVRLTFFHWLFVISPAPAQQKKKKCKVQRNEPNLSCTWIQSHFLNSPKEINGYNIYTARLRIFGKAI